MPLHGKIVVVKRSGGDGTEFPLTASCLFGRKADCDIRIQLPQVSKEHCRIDLNENKEVILTNLSSVNPTRVNGEALQQSERLKNGDVITIIDRSFRFEYPPAPTPKKSSKGDKTATLKVLQDQHSEDNVPVGTGEKRILEVATDGTNHDNIQRSLEKTLEVESKEDGNKTASPFSDLYQMIKKSLDVKTPRKPQTPSSKFCTPKPGSDGEPTVSVEDKSTPKKSNVGDVPEKISSQTPKSTMRRRSSEATPAKPAVTEEEQAMPPQKASPRSVGKVKTTSRKRKSDELAMELPAAKMKKKRVSFGGLLSPELFDKKLPPDSPLRKGAAPRRSLCLAKPKQSLLRRASAIGLISECEPDDPKVKSPAKRRSASPKSTNVKTASPKTPSPGKKSPKTRTPSPKATVGTTPVKTPAVQGRFSVSLVNTPSPIAEDAITDTVTPKIPLKRKSMKSNPRKTPSIARCTVKAIHRRSGISRASLKVKNSWADIVKFGQTKAQVAAPVKKTISKKATKKTVQKPETPARKLVGHMSTGHADSPVTIVVGRALKRQVVHPTATAPTVVLNAAVLRKNMKMDEDLTGISEMFKTPANTRKMRSASNESNVTKTPLSVLDPSFVEPSVLNTPEEPGEMMVSPLSVASTVKERRYNSDAVKRLLKEVQESSFVSDAPALEVYADDSSEQQCTEMKTTSVATPQQNPELPECLTGVERILNTPKQEDEPVEDLQGHLTTPRDAEVDDVALGGLEELSETPAPIQETEDLHEGADGSTSDSLKEIKITPEQTGAHVEDVLSVERFTKTPKEKGEPVEEHFGIKRLMKSPRLKVDAPVEDFEGLQELMQEPLSDPTAETETTEDEDQTKPDCGSETKEQELIHGEPQENVPCVQSEDVPEEVIQKVPQVDEAEGDAKEVVGNQLEVASEHDTSSARDTIPQAVVENLPEEPLEDETVTSKVEEMGTTVTDPADHKKSTRGRKAKPVKSEAADVKPEATEQPAVSAPVKGRRGKKTEDTAPPTPRQTTRSRNARPIENRDVELTQEENTSLPSKVALKPKRMTSKKVLDQAETVQETACEPEDEQSSPVDVDHATDDQAVPLEKAVLKAKRGRKMKQESEQSKPVPEKQDVPQADVTQGDEKKPSDAEEDLPESLPVMETATCKSTEMDVAIVQKSARGRRAKVVESTAAEVNQEAAAVQQPCEDAVVPAPVRARRGKRTEATAPPPVRKTTRGRHAKSQEVTSNDEPEMAVETELVTELSAEGAQEEPPMNTTQEESEALPPAEEALSKPIRGRKTKRTPVEPPAEQATPIVSDQDLAADQPQPKPTVVKQTRGRRANPVPVEQETVASEEPSQAPVKTKRGRNAKLEEKLENEEATEPKEQVKKVRRTRKAEQVQEEPHIEVLVTEAAETLPEPEKINDQPTVSAKTKRGGRKAKLDTESVSPAESNEVQEVPIDACTEKPKRGRRVKHVEEVCIATEVPEEKPEAEQKQQRTRGVKTSVKKETPQVVPTKRARRGPAPSKEESEAEATTLVSESASGSGEPAKRGRRAAAAKPTTNESTVSGDVTNVTEDLSNAVVEDTKVSKRSVKWNPKLEVNEVPKATPVKAVRGRKSKLDDQNDTESQNVSKNNKKTEEKNLSDLVVESQPTKRARRGAKVADVTAEESTSKVNPKKGPVEQAVETETQPKTRRTRAAKK